MSKKVHKIDLLLRDICARLPYKPKCKVRYIVNNETTYGEDVWFEEDDMITRVNMDFREVYTEWTSEWHDVKNVKLYLRPLESMTEEEARELNELGDSISIDLSQFDYYLHIANINQINWLLAHHFDFNNLIKTGLAIEMSKEMYNSITIITYE